MADSQQLLLQLRQMDEYEFEKLVADVWEAQGWNTIVTSGSNDRGVDVIAEKQSPFSQKMVIQAKRYSESNKVGGPEIREYASLKQQESNVDSVVVVTTSNFTPQAKQTANDLNVKLLNGDGLLSIIQEHPQVYEEYFHKTSQSTIEQTGITFDTELLPDWVKKAEYTHKAPLELLKESDINSSDVKYSFYNKQNGVRRFQLNNSNKSDRNSGVKIKPYSKYGCVILVTEDVFHVSMGGVDGDFVLEIPLDKIIDANIHEGFTKTRVEMYFEEALRDDAGNPMNGLDWWVQPDTVRLEEKVDRIVSNTVGEYNTIEMGEGKLQSVIKNKQESEERAKNLIRKLKSDSEKFDDLDWMEFNGIYMKVGKDYYKLAQKILYESDDLSPLNKPLVTHLGDSVDIDSLIMNKNYGIALGSKDNKINPSNSNNCLLVFPTDGRLIVVIGQKDSDLKIVIVPDKIKEAEFNFGLSKSRMEVVLEEPISLLEYESSTVHVWVNGSGIERAKEWVKKF